MDRGHRFRSMAKLLESNGMNIWDSRIEARRLLGIRGPYQKLGYRPTFLDRKYITNAPDSVPTIEERLDVDFWAIVSDCKAVLSGNLTPRSYADFAVNWRRLDEPTNKVTHRKVYAYEKMRATTQLQLKRLRMRRLLVLNGMSKEDAKVKARELLRPQQTEVTL